MVLYTDRGLAIYDEITRAKVRYISKPSCFPHLIRIDGTSPGLLPIRSGEGNSTDPWRRDCKLFAVLQRSGRVVSSPFVIPQAARMFGLPVLDSALSNNNSEEEEQQQHQDVHHDPSPGANTPVKEKWCVEPRFLPPAAEAADQPLDIGQGGRCSRTAQRRRQRLSQSSGAQHRTRRRTGIRVRPLALPARRCWLNGVPLNFQSTRQDPPPPPLPH